MRETRAAGGTAVFLVVAPGVVAGLVPWLLTRWEVEEPIAYWLPLQVFGGVLIVAGLVVLLDAFARFVREASARRPRSPRPSTSSSAASTGLCGIRCISRSGR